MSCSSSAEPSRTASLSTPTLLGAMVVWGCWRPLGEVCGKKHRMLKKKLLEEEMSGVQNTKRSAQHNVALSWMRRPDYISTEQTR